MPRIALLVLAVVTVLFGAASAHAEKRVALVVGNSDYRHLPALANPRHDAEDMASTLVSLGFEVIDGVDLDQIAFVQVLRKFERATRNADVALFFYAGHGLQVDGENYLAPIDAEIEAEAHVDLSMIPLRNVMRQINRRVRTGIIILDACRDNPFTVPGRGASSLQKGLSRVDAPPGYFVAFATAPGMVASDGIGGRNSPFTAGLLKHIPTPGRALSDIMIDVRLDVEAATGEMQTPWESSSLRQPFNFVASLAATRQAVAAAAIGTEAGEPSDTAFARDPHRLAEILKGFGSARIEVNSNTGNPQIDGRTDGKSYKLFFYGCTDKANCKSVQFWAYWDMEAPVDRLNAWNRDTRYGKVYLDGDNDVVLEYDVNMIYGMTDRTFEDNVDIWVTLLGRVEKEIVNN